MKDLFKTVKENVGAIITAVVVFILVSNYLIVSIPANEKKTDDYNNLRLSEFAKHLNTTFYDYANLVVADDFKCKTICYFDGPTFDFNTHIIIDTIKFENIKNLGNHWTIKRNIHFSLDSAELKKEMTENISIPKKELVQRLAGATSLPFWFIYEDKTDKNGKHIIPDNFLSNQDDVQELDSIWKYPNLNELNKTSAKRYYKTTIQPLGTNCKLIILGAVDKTDFVKQARKTDVSDTIISVIIVILLFLIIPLIKPLISSSKEKLTQFDLVSTTTSIVICTILLTISVFTYYFYSTGTEVVKNNLNKFNDTIGYDLSNEMQKYKNGNRFIFRALDSTKINQPHTDTWKLTKQYLIQKNSPYKISTIEKYLNEKHLQKEIAKYVKAKSIKFPQINFEMDTRANMERDVTNDIKFSLRKNYSDRDYIEKIKHYDTVLSAVYAKYDNQFKLVYIADLKKKFRGFVYFPSKPKLLKHLDKSYGFIVCDKSGRVLLHSDTAKWLNENVYTITNKSQKVLEVLHGMDPSYFEVDYDGKQCLFYGKKFNYDKISGSNNSPLYLFTFKDLSFENNLNKHSIIKAFITSIAFAVGIALLLLVYSAFFYYGHLSVFSKIHIYWLFPDRSKNIEFKYLTVLNYFCCIVLIVFLSIQPEDILFFTFITVINIAFINFVVLSQRVFLLNVKSEKRQKYAIHFITYTLTGMSTSLFLYHFNYPNMALLISVLTHFLFLHILKKESNTEIEKYDEKKKENQKKFMYNACLTSTICLNYVVTPAIIVLSIFVTERCRLNDINNSILEPKKEIISSTGTKTSFSEELIFNTISVTEPPSKRLLKESEFDYYNQTSDINLIAGKLFSSANILKKLCMAGGLFILILFIRLMGNFYTGRFFFFELSTISKKNYANKHKLANSSFIIPPFSDKDLEKMEETEIGVANVPEGYFFPSKIQDGNLTTAHKKLELILSKAFTVNKREYIKIWNSLNDDEKFVMYDFAVDYFVNYKNKKHLVNLIEKGLIIADPITGRLRVMNYSFRNFVIYYEKIDPNFSAEEEEKRIKGTFAKWKLPLIIIAISGLVLMMYLYKEKYDRVLLYGGSILSTLALIGRFLNTYKK